MNKIDFIPEKTPCPYCVTWPWDKGVVNVGSSACRYCVFYRGQSNNILECAYQVKPKMTKFYFYVDIFDGSTKTEVCMGVDGATKEDARKSLSDTLMYTFKSGICFEIRWNG